MINVLLFTTLWAVICLHGGALMFTYMWCLPVAVMALIVFRKPRLY